jgi:hypothetical protein
MSNAEDSAGPAARAAAAAPWPSAASFTDGLEWMKKFWGLPGAAGATGVPSAGLPFMQTLGGSVPSMFMPTMDVAELDKRIADLRSVEQWLNLNATMLRTTLQTLEVQRNTLAALQAFGGTMLASLAPAAARSEAAPAAADAGARGRSRARNPTSSAAAAATSAAAPASAAAAAAPGADAGAAAGTAVGTAVGTDGAPFNPALWWGELQDQFMRVAGAALSDSAAAAAPGSTTPADPQRAAAPPAAGDERAGSGRR